MKLCLFWSLALLGALFGPPTVAADAIAPAKRVLVLNSYHAGYKGSDDMVRGMTETLLQSHPTADIKIEYLDAKNYSGPAHDRLVLDTLRSKYRKGRFDLVLSTDDYAFTLLEKQRDTLFGATPVVFAGTNYFDPERIRGQANFFGIDEAPSFGDTLGLIVALHPQTRQVIAIHDDSETGRLNHQAFERAALGFRPRLNISTLAGAPLDELLATVRALPQGTVLVYFASFVMNANQERISSIEALRQLAAVTPVPIYGGWEFTLGHGIVGGRLVNLYSHGRAAGQLAAQVLTGGGPQPALGVHPSPNPYVFDARQLTRFQIAESALPAGSEVRHRTVGIFETHGMLMFEILSGALAVGVLMSMLKLLESRRAALRLQHKFAAIFRATPDVVSITERDSGRFFEVNDAFTRISGYAAAEVIGRNAADIGLWAARDERDNLLAKLSHEKRLSNHETVFRRKNGELFPTLMSVEQLAIDGKPYLLTSARDITERKRLEDEVKAREDRFQALFNLASDGIVVLSPSGKLVATNAAFARMHGYTPEEMQQMSLIDLDTPASAQAMPGRMKRILAGEALTFEVENFHKDGHIVRLEVTSSLVVSEGQALVQSFVRDISERKRAQERLQLAASVFIHAREGIMITSADGSILEVNTTFSEITGYERDEVIGRNPRLLRSQRQGAEFYQAMWRDLLDQGHWYCEEIWNRNKAGQDYAEKLTISAVRNGQGVTTHYVGLFSDITERIRVERALKASQHFINRVLETSPNFTYIYDLARQCNVYANREMLQFLGYTPVNVQALGDTMLSTVVHPEDFGRIAQHHAKFMTLGDGAVADIEYRVRDASGQYRCLHSRDVVFLRNDNGQVEQILGVAQDITERKQMELQVHQLAFHDALTNLPNRRLLSDRLRQGLAACKRNNGFGALIFLDLDHFKPLNDQYGHEVGDLLLLEVAQRLTGCVRETDTVARFGGDEFVVMLGELTSEHEASVLQAAAVAEKIRRSLAAPYHLQATIDGKSQTAISYVCAASIGVTLFGKNDNSQADILKWADTAMYQAKDAGRNQIRFYSPDTPPEPG
ncbi:MAG: PAS domain S-box protein [Rhodoferax sp.]|nr:PAS domain S-box protein [Rhodoferax sp.]